MVVADIKDGNRRLLDLICLRFANIILWMNVISRPAIIAAAQRHPNAEIWLNVWWKVAKSERWTSLHSVRAVYPSADQVGGCLIFDAPKGRRLIVGVIWADETKNGTLFVKHFLTHAEYDKGKWKKDCMK